MVWAPILWIMVQIQSSCSLFVVPCCHYCCCCLSLLLPCTIVVTTITTTIHRYYFYYHCYHPPLVFLPSLLPSTIVSLSSLSTYTTIVATIIHCTLTQSFNLNIMCLLKSLSRCHYHASHYQMEC